MERWSFDELVRSLDAGGTRRSLLGGMAGALAASLALPDGGDARRKRRNNHGKGKGTKRKQRRSHKNQNQNGSNSTNTSGNSSGQIFNVCAEAGTRACSRLDVQTSASINQCNLAGATLADVVAKAFAGDQINFRDADLQAANFSAANLSRTCFAGATLRNAVLTATNLDFADFTGADLCGVNFTASTVTPAQVRVGEVCCATILADGSSAAPCPDGWECCGELCADVQTDPDNCGSCGYTCGVGELCDNGGCIIPVG